MVADGHLVALSHVNTAQHGVAMAASRHQANPMRNVVAILVQKDPGHDFTSSAIVHHEPLGNLPHASTTRASS